MTERIVIHCPGQGKPAYLEDGKTGQCQPIPCTYQEIFAFFVDYINDLYREIERLEVGTALQVRIERLPELDKAELDKICAWSDLADYTPKTEKP